MYRHAYRHILVLLPLLSVLRWGTCLMINMFSQMASICHFVLFFMSCPELPMGISGVDSFPVQSGGSLIIFQLLRCRNLALNRVFSLLFLRGRHVLYLQGCLETPYVCKAPYICTPPVYSYTPYVPILMCICMFSEAFACCWGCKGSPYMLDTSLTPSCMGVPHMFTPPTNWLPCVSVCFGDVCMWYGEYFPYVWAWGMFPHLLGVLWASAHGVSICLFLYNLVVHYVSHFYYCYDYYSCSYGGVFWAVISVISYHGSFPDGSSCNIGSLWSSSKTTLDAKRLWKCYWPCLYATAATSHLWCLFQAYANYAMGSPQVGFFFRVEPPTILCWCPFWCLLSTFRCQVGCHIHLLGLNH